MEIFTIREEDFLSPEKVKIIDGIAGAGKSSVIHNFFSNRGIEYLRTTSTNVLKRDAERRYDIQCDTIAGGLFTTENGKFFSSEKYPDIKTIVIDEILQTSPRVIDWIRSHRGEYNIIITTDTKQMLTQDNGQDFLIRFLEYAKTDEVIYRCLTETKRARNEETKELYNELYNEVDKEARVFEKIEKKFEKKNFENISYNLNDIFICHTKEIEDFIYKEWKLSEGYDFPLIPKGNIAKKEPKDPTKYPILSQIKAEDKKGAGARGYLQIANLATPTRYQGSEVTAEQTLYYIIERHSVILNREIYTVLTRCYDYKSLVIVYIDLPQKDDITTFFEKPVKRLEYAHIETDNPEDFMPDPDDDRFKIQEIVEKMDSPDGIAWDPDGIIINGEFYSNFKKENEEGPKPRFTAKSLIQKESYFDYSFMPTVYKILEKHDIKHITYCHTKNNGKRKENYEYYLDIYSAYPTILKYGRLPIDGAIYTEPSPDKMNFYKYTGNALTENCIITDEVAEIVQDDKKEYLFSTDYRTGSHIGDYLHEKAFKSVEDKQSIKCMHYGYYQKPFLQEVTISGGCYIREDEYNHELLMVAICSQLFRVLFDLQEVQDGYVCVDALHFKDISKKWEFVNFMKKNYPDFDYRIKKKETDTKGEQTETLLYQSYPELKTKRQNRTEYENRRRKQK